MSDDRTTANAVVAKTPCPSCGAHRFELEQRLKAKEVGDFSLSGAQMKFSAAESTWLVCRACGIEAEGHA